MRSPQGSVRLSAETCPTACTDVTADVVCLMRIELGVLAVPHNAPGKLGTLVLRAEKVERVQPRIRDAFSLRQPTPHRASINTALS